MRAAARVASELIVFCTESDNQDPFTREGLPIEARQLMLCEQGVLALAVALLKERASHEGVALELVAPHAPCPLGRRDRLEQVAFNLVKNALECGAKRVTVRTRPDGFEVVDELDHDVLLLRPAIIDLDITAPDSMSAGRTRTFSATTGSATLYIELYDAVSGQIIGRAGDRQAVRNAGGSVSWSNRVTNTADARRMFSGWASTLRTFLDSHYSQ